MALSYAEACDRLNDIISDLGFPLFMGEAKEAETVKAVRKQVSSLYSSLDRENKLDLLHASGANNKAELIEQSLHELFNRIEELEEDLG